MKRSHHLRAMTGLTVAAASIAVLTGMPQLAADQQKPAQQPIRRNSQVRSLPGQLDNVLMLNDNNPELITGEGILVSTFPSDPGLDVSLNGRFDLFSHHVYSGQPDQLDSTLWLAVVAEPAGEEPVTLKLLGGSTSLSQATRKGQTAAPFLPMPALMAESGTAIASGPGSRVAGDLLRGDTASELQKQWRLEPDSVTALVVLPIPVAGLDPLLNGRNLQLRLQSSGPVHVATLAALGSAEKPPEPDKWRKLLKAGRQSPKEHQPTPRGARGKIVYSRVSGVQIGSTWTGTLTDPGSSHLNVDDGPISWPISSLERGDLGTGQVQTAELKRFDAGTAWAAHGNYGVEYDLTLPLRNDGSQRRTVAISLESPDKSGSGDGALLFNGSTSGPVMFRGPIEVTGLDGEQGRPSGRRRFHLVLRRGQQGPELGRITLAPGETRSARVRLVYPADATPPQVLSLLPVKQSKAAPGDRP